VLGEVRCSGRYGVTEFFSERSITFHITAGVERAKSLPHFVLETGSDLVK